MALKNKFNFSGEVVFPKSDAKRPFVTEYDKNKKKSLKLNFGIKDSNGYMVFVEGFNGQQDVIKTKDSDYKDIEVKWNDRFDEEIVNMVAYSNKFFVDLGEEFGGRKEFIAQYDALEFLKENLPKYKGNVAVTGTFKLKPYQGKVYETYELASVYAIDKDQKTKLSLTMDIYYNKDSIDKTDVTEDKKIYIDGYLSQYLGKDEGNKYFPHRFVFNIAAYDMENEKHVARYKYRMKYIDIKNKTMVHIPWDVRLIRGAEGVEFNESMLTPSQKEQVELGIKKLDDFKPKGEIKGNKITEFRLTDPILVEMGKENNFTDGVIDTDLKMSEFEEEIYVAVVEEKLEDVVKSAEKKAEVKEETKVEKESEAPSVDDDDLF